jgi:FAD-linked oxidoreductase
VTATGETWRNWARTEQARPIRVERPASAEAVQRAVRAAAASGLRVKPVGAGHSFSGIAVAPDVQLDLDDLSGIVDADTRAGLVTVGAGTRLHRMPRLIDPLGLAMANLGDIDRQSIAGATSTGTHGTGLAFGGLATQVAGVTLVTGTGELVRIDEHERPELLPAVRLGLGALGVLTAVTLRLVPRFGLHAVEHREPLEQVLAEWQERVRSNDHFEFYWFPHTATALTKTNTRLSGDSALHPLSRTARWISDELLANGAYRGICAIGSVVPATVPLFAKIVDRVTGKRDFSDASTHVFTTNRTVRFREMEVAIPLASVPDALAEVRELIERRRWRISFPIEVRAAASDDLWLSTAYGRETGYIAVHRYLREDPAEYFAAVEQILMGHGGRPHWGKMHSQTAETLRPRYPRFDDFLRVRDEFDPDRRFANPYLDRVLGP